MEQNNTGYLEKMGMDRAKAQLERFLIPVLEKAYLDGVTEFRLSMVDEKHFVVHPLNVDGTTVDVAWNPPMTDLRINR